MPPALLQFCLYQDRGITHSYIIYQPPPVFLVILRLIIAVLHIWKIGRIKYTLRSCALSNTPGQHAHVCYNYCAVCYYQL